MQFQNKHLLAIDWLEEEVVSFDQINASVIKYYKKWVNKKILEIKFDGVCE
jgi:hypothetical protein